MTSYWSPKGSFSTSPSMNSLFILNSMQTRPLRLCLNVFPFIFRRHGGPKLINYNTCLENNLWSISSVMFVGDTRDYWSHWIEMRSNICLILCKQSFSGERDTGCEFVWHGVSTAQYCVFWISSSHVCLYLCGQYLSSSEYLSSICDRQVWCSEEGPLIWPSYKVSARQRCHGPPPATLQTHLHTNTNTIINK